MTKKPTLTWKRTKEKHPHPRWYIYADGVMVPDHYYTHNGTSAFYAHSEGRSSRHPNKYAAKVWAELKYLEALNDEPECSWGRVDSKDRSYPTYQLYVDGEVHENYSYWPTSVGNFVAVANAKGVACETEGEAKDFCLAQYKASRANAGKSLKYTGASDEQAVFGGCDDPRPLLSEGGVYVEASRDVHSWHTKIRLVGVTGQFNSVCFENV